MRELLPRVFTLAFQKRRLFSVALSVVSPSRVKRLPVRKYGALRCPDFPLHAIKLHEAIETLPQFVAKLVKKQKISIVFPETVQKSPQNFFNSKNDFFNQIASKISNICFDLAHIAANYPFLFCSIKFTIKRLLVTIKNPINVLTA